MTWTFISFDAFIASLQEESWSVKFGKMCMEYLGDIQHTRSLLTAIDDGLTLPTHMIEQITQSGLMVNIGRKHLLDEENFSDDELFTATRFALTMAYWRANPPWDDERFLVATAQLGRMLDSGRMAPDERYLSDYIPLANANGDIFPVAQLAAHFPSIENVVQSRVVAAQRSGGSSNSNADEYWMSIEDEALRILAATALLKEVAFRQRWLPSAISPAELVDTQHVVLPVLQELYHDIWTDGYGGYHARMRQR